MNDGVNKYECFLKLIQILEASEVSLASAKAAENKGFKTGTYLQPALKRRIDFYYSLTDKFFKEHVQSDPDDDLLDQLGE